MNLEVSIENNSEAWDQYVSSSRHGHYMQSHAWGVLQQHFGWETTFLVARKSNTIRGSALLLSRIIPVLGKKLFYAPRGPVADSYDPETVASLCAAMMQTVRKERGIFARFDPYVPENVLQDSTGDPNGLRKLSREWSYWNAPKFVFWLDLTPDEDTLLKNMTTTCRSEVRLGYKKGVTYAIGNRDDLDEFYRLMRLTARYKSIAVHNADYYRRLYDIMNLSGRVELFLARYEGKTIAAGMSICYGEKAWLLYAASDHEYRKLKPNRTLQWEMIKWARREGCMRYDFRGTATGDPPNVKDPGYGLYEFKRSFGPQFTRLEGYFDLVASPALYRLLRHAEEKALPLAFRIKSWLDRRRYN
jgi:peptidoglycan pentaglycine glycine transferase (the first glycine)